MNLTESQLLELRNKAALCVGVAPLAYKVENPRFENDPYLELSILCTPATVSALVDELLEARKLLAWYGDEKLILFEDEDDCGNRAREFIKNIEGVK